MAPSSFFFLAPLLLLNHLAAANTCNGDNCLNALNNRHASALDFCHTYTTALYGTAAPTPTWVPTTCYPQRLSSACYCADRVSNPTYTPAACPTAGQVLENPSFYGQPAADSRNVDIRPWVIAVPTGAPGCVPAVGYSLADMSGAWGDPRSIQCRFDPVVGGLSTITQDIKLCPSTQYTLRISTACDFWTGSGAFGIEFKVAYAGITILNWGPVCPFCADPANAEASGCRYGAYYEKRTATFTTPTAGAGSLVVSVRQPAGLNATQVPALFDQIFVNPLGDTSSGNPSQISF